MKKPDPAHWFLLAVIAVLMFYLFLSPWRYERWRRGDLVRINRVYGNAELLYDDGWEPMEKKKEPPTRGRLRELAPGEPLDAPKVTMPPELKLKENEKTGEIRLYDSKTNSIFNYPDSARVIVHEQTGQQALYDNGKIIAYLPARAKVK